MALLLYFAIGYMYGMYILFFGVCREEEVFKLMREKGISNAPHGLITLARFMGVICSELLWPIDMICEVAVFTKNLIKKLKK